MLFAVKIQILISVIYEYSKQTYFVHSFLIFIIVLLLSWGEEVNSAEHLIIEVLLNPPFQLKISSCIAHIICLCYMECSAILGKITPF